MLFYEHTFDATRRWAMTTYTVTKVRMELSTDRSESRQLQVTPSTVAVSSPDPRQLDITVIT